MNVKKYLKYVSLFVAGYLVCMFAGAGVANAAELKIFETGIAVESDFTDFQGTTSFGNAKIYTEGELDLKDLVIDWDARTGWTGGTFSKDIDGSVGVYARIYTTKGRSFELLGGVHQPVYFGDGKLKLSNTRTFLLRVRKPL